MAASFTKKRNSILLFPDKFRTDYQAAPTRRLLAAKDVKLMVIQRLPALGNVNAAHTAYIKDSNGKTIGTCMDTPNNAAYAFTINSAAETISTPFNGDWTRKNLKAHFNGLDADYHKKYVKYY